ncbi:hypothetical protein FGO68_gene11491 [Halteria grandinella]|uniref:Uncharacterized protein n=1 Tax=Halteria grandinella TaxID=5974 RepID=A0A8J8SVQ4_HALGN|nr:hypothetical protein FGO68_gene11491 [Halteria grandinella]
MNTEQQLPTQSENISRQPQMQQQKSAKVPQRPSSSKPILKNATNEGDTGPIVISKVQRPSSPGVAANKIVKASIVSNSGSKPTKVRLRSASPQQQNQQQPLQIQQAYQQPAPASTQFKMSAVNQRIPITTAPTANKQQPPQMQYMRGYSPSKPKWKM